MRAVSELSYANRQCGSAAARRRLLLGSDPEAQLAGGGATPLHQHGGGTGSFPRTRAWVEKETVPIRPLG